MIWRIATGFFLAISVVQTVRVFSVQSAQAAPAQAAPAPDLVACAKEVDRYYSQVLYLCHSANHADPEVARICGR